MSNILQLAINILLKLINLFPISVMVLITKYILVLMGYRKQVINKNYKSTTLNKYSATGFKNFYKKNLGFVARLIVESIKTLSDKSIDRISFKNIEKLESKCLETKGVILLASHFGNWELACSLLPLHTDLPCYGVYKPLKNKTIDQVLLSKRSKFGLQLIPMKKIGRTIIENVKSNTPAIYILIADQNPNSKNSIEWAPFFGVNTAWFNGPMKLQKRYNFNVAYMDVEVGPEFFEYRINIDTDFNEKENEKNLVESYSNLLEDKIKQAPQYWLWSHKRWKRSF